jgi:glycosyltransferase involved in cell wall biosynthesis
MKILIGVHHFPPDRIGGAELRAFDMAVWLIQNGHQVQVITVRDVFDGEQNEIQFVDEVYEGINVRRLNIALADSAERFEYLYDNPLIEKTFTDYLNDFSPHVFHLLSGYLLGAGVIRAAKSFGIPVAITLTDFWFICPRINMLRPDGTASEKEEFNAELCASCMMEDKRRFRLLDKLVPGVMRPAARKLMVLPGELKIMVEKIENRYSTLLDILNKVDSWIFPSRNLMEVFEMRGLNKGRMKLIPHGINVENLYCEPKKVKKPIRIGYLGQIESHKGVHILIEAFRRAQKKHDISLSIYGSLSTNAGFRNLIQQRVNSTPQVHLHGKYINDQLYKILENLDVVVIPSIWNEIGPLVLYEALRSKVPVIASNIPNMSNEIQNGINGLLFEVGNVSELAKIFEYLADNPAKLEEMSRNIQPVRLFTEEMEAVQNEYFRITGNKK